MTDIITIQTSLGDITVELDREKAPQTVENFLHYLGAGFYENTLFHRVIPNFMIQGGGFDTNFNQKPAPNRVENEADNGLENAIGTIAMARTADPHSASSQFFINTGDNGFLNYKSRSTQGWGYCVFGKVTEGMDVVDAISSTSTGNRMGHQDVPTEDILIKNIIQQ
ncbi:MAG: peptidylprolyl isomerase [Arenicella sp.]